MRRWTSGLLAAIATLAGALSATAEASPLPANFLPDAIADFNVITNGNFTQNNDVNGPVLVGGNLISSGHPINSTSVVPLPQPITGLGEVNVFGSVSGSVNQSVGGGSVVLVGGTTPSVITFTGKNTALSVLNGNVFPYTFSDIWAQMTGMASSLGSLAPTYTVTSTTLDGIPNASGVAVLTVPLSTLNNLSGLLNFTGCLSLSNPTCDAVILVTNDDPNNTTFHQGFNYGGLTAAQQNLIWVFEAPGSGTPGITGVNINTEWWSSVLATGADVENTAPIVGNTIANTVDSSGGNGEFHVPVFDCSDNLCSSMTAPPNGVPEPGSLALLATGLGVFAVIRRRRA